ncbi:MAG: ATP-binding cassette domain-containing protein, partial [Alphaproteobacteria bacterium]|nr:ATP-binding cassette domain-containing protein [Alphaproteobacteria bacterium]
AMITLTDINFSYEKNRQALHNVSCTFAENSFSVIVGASGCGKSTLLRLLAGLEEPTSGALIMPPALSTFSTFSTGFVFQDPTLLAWRNVYDNIALPLKIKGLDKTSRHTRTQEALALVGLAERADAHPRELSGGMKMRVSLARALASRPRLLLMDEPFAALDEHTRFRLEDDLRNLQQTLNCTIIFVTHSVAQAAYLGERVLVMGASETNDETGDETGGSIKHILNPPAHQQDWRHNPAFHAACATISAALAEVEAA